MHAQALQDVTCTKSHVLLLASRTSWITTCYHHLFQQYIFPSGSSVNQYVLRVLDSLGHNAAWYVSSSLTEYTLHQRSLGEEYNISIRAFARFSQCYSLLHGESSDEVVVTTVETGTYSCKCSYICNFIIFMQLPLVHQWISMWFLSTELP